MFYFTLGEWILLKAVGWNPIQVDKNLSYFSLGNAPLVSEYCGPLQRLRDYMRGVFQENCQSIEVPDHVNVQPTPAITSPWILGQPFSGLTQWPGVQSVRLCFWLGKCA